MPKTIVEPFKVKMVEEIEFTTREQREQLLAEAQYNVFRLDADKCCIDLLTDSGTGAMSAKQWAALMQGDESYAGSRSWKKFYRVVHEITDMPHVFPTHQGRAAESIFFSQVLKADDVIANNCHFDTTRANIECLGAKACDLIADQDLDPDHEADFKGNIDLNKLQKFIDTYGKDRMPFAMLTVTNNSAGGQPVSMQNVREMKALLNLYKIPLVMDVCRFAENSFFIQQREAGYAEKSLLTIAQEMFSYADAAIMSCKKDAIANIGGFFVCHDEDWAQRFRMSLILREGFPTYGGLAGRDLECIAVGLKEALMDDYQKYRHATIQYLGNALSAQGVPVVKPFGGHAIFIDAGSFLPHISALEFPGIALTNALYLEGGVRGVEIGSAMFGSTDEQGCAQPAKMEFVRLAIPRRVYTQSHFDYLIEVFDLIAENRKQLSGFRMINAPKDLRHFVCGYQPLAKVDKQTAVACG